VHIPESPSEKSQASLVGMNEIPAGAELNLVIASATSGSSVGNSIVGSSAGQNRNRVDKKLEMKCRSPLGGKEPASCYIRYVIPSVLGWRNRGRTLLTIMPIMGHFTATVSQRHVHPSPQAELAYERFTSLNLLPPLGRRRCWHNAVNDLFSICPGGEIGRRKGLKILFSARRVRVQVPPRAP
jgi:hypothetical protein